MGKNFSDSVFAAIFRDHDSELMVLDPTDYTIRAANQTFLDRHQTTLEQVVGQKCHSFDRSTDGCMPPCELCPVARTMESRAPTTLEHRYRLDANSETRHLEIKVIPIYDRLGNVEWLLHRCRDITERVRVRERLMDEERVRNLTDVARTVSHKFLNKLVGVVQLCSELLNDSIDPRQIEGLETIRMTALDIERRARTALKLGRMDFSHAEYLDLEQLLNDSVEEMTQYGLFGRCEVKVAFVGGLPAILASRDDLMEVIRNLVLNALQSMSHVERPVLELRTRVRGAAVEFEVIDNGEGIPDEHLERVSDPFFSTKGERGSGLGLSIVKNLVAKYAGTLQLASEMGVGTRARVDIPAAEPAKSAGSAN